MFTPSDWIGVAGGALAFGGAVWRIARSILTAASRIASADRANAEALEALRNHYELEHTKLVATVSRQAERISELEAEIQRL